MSSRPGVGGSLFSTSFLTSLDDGRREDRVSDPRQRELLRWWSRAEQQCGPATALRALFDIVAMPLAAILGYRARDACFNPRFATASLDAGGTRLLLFLLPWAARLPAAWRDIQTARRGYDWGLVIAPPYVSVVDLRSHAVRRSLDFRFPHVLDPRSVDLFLLLSGAASFSDGDRSRLHALVDRANVHHATVRRDLQAGVTTALAGLAPLVRGGSLDEALTLVYRLLFLLFAESRELTPAADATGSAYGVTRLCHEAWRSSHTRGLWSALAAITRLSRSGCHSRSLIVAPFNGHLFSRESAPSLEAAGRARQPSALSTTRDAALGRALIALGSRTTPAGREEISFADLGVEQLGAVYERVLDLDEEALQSRPGQAPAIRSHSPRRKEHGTFYTPQPLAEYVVRRTLAPLVRDRSPDDILRLRVVDPAMGSGAFLVAACRYLADAYERALVDEGRHADADFDETRRSAIRRLVAARCLAGVDVNPTAVQLARLSLWLATLARDKPLSFFDHQLRTGNSLVGASPEDLWRRRRSGAGSVTNRPLFEAAGLEHDVREVLGPMSELRARSDDSIVDVHAREHLWRRIRGAGSPVAKWRTACDLWCSQWFTSTGEASPGSGETRAAIDAVLRDDRVLPAARLRHRLESSKHAAETDRFFHWPLEFPDVFHDREGVCAASRGFDAVIGNPPWEMLRRGDGTTHSRQAEVAFIRESGLYPLSRRGHLNLYQPFLERSLSILKPGGRAGLILPWSFATDDGSAELRDQLTRQAHIDSLLGLDNALGLFPIHRGLRFAALVAVKAAAVRDIPMRMGVKTVSEIESLPDSDTNGDAGNTIHVSTKLLRLVGGPQLRFPDARSPEDLAWLAAICRQYPPLGAPEGWNLSFGRELNATEDRVAFGTAGLPVIDGKHIAQFRVVLPDELPRIDPVEARRRLPDRRFSRPRLAYRDVSGVGNRHTVIAAIIPGDVVTTHTLFCLRQALDAEQQNFLCGLFNSATLNSYVRMLMGSHVTTSLIEQMPVPIWTGSAAQRGIASLAVRLSQPAHGDELKTELDAQVARLYANGL